MFFSAQMGLCCERREIDVEVSIARVSVWIKSQHFG